MKSKTTTAGSPAHDVAPVVQKSKPAASTATPAKPTALTPSVLDAAQAQWADKINQRLSEGLEALIEAGSDLNKAKTELGHGGFGAMFKLGLVKIDQRTAERLMRVAGNKALSNSTNWSILPRSIQSLDKLAALDAPAIEQAIKAGEITPAMTIADAGDFVRSKRDAHPKKAPKAAAAAAAPEDAAEPESPSVGEDKTSAYTARFDVQEFKAALTQFLEREYAKASGVSAVEMQAAAAAACSVFFSACITTTSKPADAVTSVLRVDGEKRGNHAALPPGKNQENGRGVQQLKTKASDTTTASSMNGQTMPAFRKSYPLTDEDRARLEQDLATLKTTDATNRAYNDALRHITDTGHYLAVAGSLDAFCADFLGRDSAEVKLALEREKSASQSKKSEQPAPAPVETGPVRPLSLKEKIALRNQAVRVTA